MEKSEVKTIKPITNPKVHEFEKQTQFVILNTLCEIHVCKSCGVTARRYSVCSTLWVDSSTEQTLVDNCNKPPIEVKPAFVRTKKAK